MHFHFYVNYTLAYCYASSLKVFIIHDLMLHHNGNTEVVFVSLDPSKGFRWILTHWGRVTHVCVGNLTIIGSDNGLSPGGRSHNLNQCWNIVNWTPRNNLLWNVNRNSYIFIHENQFENVVWKMAAILSLPQCVKRKSVLGIKFLCCLYLNNYHISSPLLS